MNTTDQIAVMQAYVDGKQIQFYDEESETWKTTNEPCWDWMDYEYRIKPKPEKPTYRPYSNFDEFRAEWEKHGGWTINELNCYSLINYVITLPAFDFFRDLVEKHRWADDGTPCGIKVEE